MKIVKYLLYIFLILDVIIILAFIFTPPSYSGSVKLKIYGSGSGTYTSDDRKVTLLFDIELSEHKGSIFKIVFKKLEVWSDELSSSNATEINREIYSISSGAFLCKIILRIPTDIKIGTLSGSSILEGKVKFDVYYQDTYLKTEEMHIWGGGVINEDASGNGEYNLTIQNETYVAFQYIDSNNQIMGIIFFGMILIILLLIVRYIRKKESIA